jgi:hypothetical protein
MAWNDPAIRMALRTAWDYLRLVHAPRLADLILTPGQL